MWNAVQNAWVVCSELGKKGKSKSSKTIGAVMLLPLAMVSVMGTMTTASAAECTVMGNGSIRSTPLGNHNVNGCEVSSISHDLELGEWGNMLRVYAKGRDTTVKVTEDLKVNLNTAQAGLAALAADGGKAYIDARGKTIDITMQQNPTQAQLGAVISHGSQIDVGTLNLQMNDLIGNYSKEHYGVLAGSSVDAGELATTNGQVSEANFDHLNIKMNAKEGGSLLAGIRAIQGAHKSNGFGSDGIVRVNDKLNIDLNHQGTSTADVTGIYISGGNSQVHLKDSEIKITSNSNRANAMQIGKSSGAGSGAGQFYSTGEMILDTTASEKSNGAINIQSQGSVIDANADTSSTSIKTATDGIYVAGTNATDDKTTTTSFNNLTIETTKSTDHLVNVTGNQKDYQLNIRGEDSNLTAADEGYMVNVMGSPTRPSNVTMNFNDGHMQGLVQQADGSNLKMNLKDATWQLAHSGANAIASFNQLNLINSRLIAFDQANKTAGKKSEFTLAGDVKSRNSSFDMQNDFAGDRLTIDGNYTTGRNDWLMDAHLTGLGESVSSNDQVKITGNVIDGGFDWVTVKNLNLDNPTGLETLLVFDIDGNSDGHFLLKDRVVKGSYEYLLNQNSENGNWYLESVGPSEPVDPVEPEELIPVMPMLPSVPPKPVEPEEFIPVMPVLPTVPPKPVDPVEPEEFIPVMPVLPTVPPKPVDPVDPVEPEEFIPVMPVLPTVPPKPVDPVDPKEPVQPKTPVIRPEAGSYAFNAKMANNIFTHRLEDRVGASTYTNMNDDNVGQLWIRTEGGRIEFKDSKGQVRTEGNHYLLHTGVGLANFGENDQFNIGIMGAYAKADSDSKSKITAYQSSSKIDGYGLGVYGTWYQNPQQKDGAYVDTWLMWNDFDNEVAGYQLKTEKYNASGLTASIEAGTSFKLSENKGKAYWIQPQAQVIYQGVKLDHFTENTGTVVQQDDANIQTRLGAKAYVVIPTHVAQGSNYRPYVALNWITNSESNAVMLDGTHYGLDGDRNIGEVKLGIEGQTSKNSHAWMNVGYEKGDDSYADTKLNLGWKVNF